jgi:hypothetical protein
MVKHMRQSLQSMDKGLIAEEGSGRNFGILRGSIHETEFTCSTLNYQTLIYLSTPSCED